MEKKYTFFAFWRLCPDNRMHYFFPRELRPAQTHARLCRTCETCSNPPTVLNSWHNMVIFFIPGCLFSMSFSFWNPHPSPPRLFLPNSHNPFSALQWNKERIWSIATKLKPEKENIPHCRTLLRYITSGSGVSAGVWRRDRNECLSVWVWRWHVCISRTLRTMVLSFAMWNKKKRWKM